MKYAAFIAMAFAGAAAAAGAQGGKQMPQAIASVVDCRKEQQAEARLRCFDQAAAALDKALGSGAVVAMDKDAVRKTRRGLFGFNIPKLPFLGEGEQVSEIRSTVRRAQESGFQRWTIELENEGGVWTTVDAQSNYAPPKPGSAATIRRGPLSYMMSVGGRGGIRVRRVR